MIGRRLFSTRTEHLFWVHWYGLAKKALLEFIGGAFIALCFAFMMAVGVCGSYTAAFNALLNLLGVNHG